MIFIYIYLHLYVQFWILESSRGNESLKPHTNFSGVCKLFFREGNEQMMRSTGKARFCLATKNRNRHGTLMKQHGGEFDIPPLLLASK